MSAKLPEIKDIKAMVDIPDISIYIYWGIITLAVLGLIVALYFLVRYILRLKPKRDKAKDYLEALHQIDWSNPKKAAYEATKYGRLLATDDRRRELFSQLLPLLERYKYRKNVDRVDRETIKRFELYRNICDESI